MSSQKLYTASFLQLCFSGFLFFSSFNLIIPELPGFLRSMGGEQYIGLIIALFTLTAGISRPFSGKLTDNIGRVPVMIIGASVCMLAGFIYPLVNTVFAFLLLRFFHGFSTGFKPTGTAAYVADVVPVNRRGEAMGVLGFFSSIGIAMGPTIGSFIAAHFSLDAMFYCSSIFSFSSILILINMRETLENRKKFNLSMLKITKADVYTPSILPAAIVMMFSVYAFGTVLTIIPDFSDSLQIANKGYFFAYFTVASLMVRIFMGKLSDKYGREPILIVALIGLTITLFFTGSASTENELLFAAFMLGFFVGFLSPTIFAWAIDLSGENQRGRAMATLYIALEIGIGSGALFSGLIYANKIENVIYVFWACALSTLIALIYLVYYQFTKKQVISQ
ncbi:MAG: MFS transporter [Calditrichaeota bacterium]|nr:MFS transporter [Calditrichota bacterium]